MININIYILLWVVLFSEGFFHDAFIMYHPHYWIWKSGTNLATLIGYRWYIVNRMWKRSHENSILIKRESEREREREREKQLPRSPHGTLLSKWDIHYNLLEQLLAWT